MDAETAERSAQQGLGLVGDQPGQRQRRGRRRRGRVAHEERALGARDEEVVDAAPRRGRAPGRGPRPARRRSPRRAAPGPAAARCATSARFEAACSNSVRPARQYRQASRQVPGQASVSRRSAAPDPAELICVPRAGDQRGRAEQNRAVGAAGQVGAEEGQRGIGDRVDVGARPDGRARGAGAGRRRGRGRSGARRAPRPRPRAGPPRPPRRRSPPGARVAPGRWIDRSAGRSSRPRSRGAPSRRRARRSSANAAATAAKSTTPVYGECRAPTPAAWGSTSAISVASRRRRPGTPLACPRRSSSARRPSSACRVATISLPVRGAAIPRSSQYS